MLRSFGSLGTARCRASARISAPEAGRPEHYTVKKSGRIFINYVKKTSYFPSKITTKSKLRKQELRLKAERKIYDYVPFQKKTGPEAALELNDRPIVVKDNIATLRGQTTCASKILHNHRSPYDAYVVERLRRAKAEIVGKTNLDEFGMGSHSVNSYFGRVENREPYEGRSAGGSSGGSAVAVARYDARIGLGTDTGGSVRLPAAYTGTVGFKPSYGVISRWGVVPYANSLDTVGIIARDTYMVAKALVLAHHPDPRDPTCLTPATRTRCSEGQKRLPSDGKGILEPLSLSGVTFGVPKEYVIAELDETVRQAWDDTLSILKSNGAKIVPISLPNTKHALSAYYVLAPAEAASNLAKYDGVRYGYREKHLTDGRGDVLYSETRGDGFGEEVKRRILLGSFTLSSEAIDNYFIKAQKVRRLVQRDFDRVFRAQNPLRDAEQHDLSDMDESVSLDDKLGPSQVDFIISPTAPTIPPLLDDLEKTSPVDTYMNDVFTVPASLAGIPAISIPFPCLRARHQITPGKGFVGIQIMGQYYQDRQVISISQELERLLVDLKADILAETENIRRYNSLYQTTDFSGRIEWEDVLERDDKFPEGSPPVETPTESPEEVYKASPELVQEELERSFEHFISRWRSGRLFPRLTALDANP